MSESDSARARIKAQFIEARGYWRPWTEAILHAHPAFLEQYARYAGYPARHGPLSARMVELIYVALDASSAHLYAAGLKTHLAGAFAAGANEADVFDVLHLVAAQGLECVYQSAAILAQEAAQVTPSSFDAALGERIARLCPQAACMLKTLATLDRTYVDVLLDFLEHGATGGGLNDAERNVIQIALHACFTAFNPDAVRRLVRVALEAGVTAPGILQAMQLGAHLSVHGTALGATVIGELRAPAL
ncbi:carboxymuconolactone decarboxylase family protein [Paraburkholderia nodosa]|uniref:carboxymuconolactone decarboxylase family protein n=1 Tax=Paraburkholderia nodosa TaxID=392320 RepID=UPI000483EF0B|nr:carboxymuconolactone decarboxylase family protein [Paraburkholderia nodosa]